MDDANSLHPMRFVAGAESAGRRLDEFLAARLGALSRMRIAALFERGDCLVNGARAHAGRRLRAGDAIDVLAAVGAPNSMTAEPLPLAILYEDEHLLVVDKPAGMLVHPTRGVKTGTLANGLAYHLNAGRQLSDEDTPAALAREAPAPVRPGLVHRLDRATSGLLVVAKHQRALSILSRHFHERRVEKRYLALVLGRPRRDEQVVRAPIGCVGGEVPHWRVTEEGRPAETRLRVLERRAGLTLVELEPVTGRTNQLRIHCAHAGHPIAGDEWYGGACACVARLCLHAARLSFHHPAGGAWLEFVSPLPAAISDAFERAGAFVEEGQSDVEAEAVRAGDVRDEA